MKNMFGDTYVRLTVVKHLDDSCTEVRCQCICGILIRAAVSELESGKVTSCGCGEEAEAAHMEYVDTEKRKRKGMMNATDRSATVDYLDQVLTIGEWSKRFNIPPREVCTFFSDQGICIHWK